MSPLKCILKAENWLKTHSKHELGSEKHCECHAHLFSFLDDHVVFYSSFRWTIISSTTGQILMSWRTQSLWRRSIWKETRYKKTLSIGERSCWRCPVYARLTLPLSAFKLQHMIRLPASQCFISPHLPAYTDTSASTYQSSHYTQNTFQHRSHPLFTHHTCMHVCTHWNLDLCCCVEAFIY